MGSVKYARKTASWGSEEVRKRGQDEKKNGGARSWQDALTKRTSNNTSTAKNKLFSVKIRYN